MTRIVSAFALAIGALCLCPAAAFAQAYPSKTVRMIVTFPAGGGVDFMGRVIGQKLSERLGQQVVIDNRGGANGMIGAELVVNAKPDGYTLLMPTSSTVAINPAVYKKMPFDPVADLAPVTPVVAAPGVMFVTPSLPVKNIREFIALAKARPGEIVFASSGAGSNTHLALELFQGEAKIKVTHVPYKGAGPAVVDVMAGHAQAMVADLPVLAPHLRSGKLRALAIAGLERTALFPDIPSMKELGYPQVNSRNWYALLAPARTPPEIINRLNEAVRQAVADPGVRDRLVGIGADIFTMAPDEFGKFLKSEIARWKGVVAKYHLKLEL